MLCRRSFVVQVGILLCLLWICCGVTCGVDGAVEREASRTVELTPDNFDDYVGREDKYVFVLYCVRWSRSCDTMSTLWDRLSISQSQSYFRDSFTAATVDGEKYPELIARMKVVGFPTMVYYTPLEPEGIEYRGGRELVLLDSFVFQYS